MGRPTLIPEPWHSLALLIGGAEILYTVLENRLPCTNRTARRICRGTSALTLSEWATVETLFSEHGIPLKTAKTGRKPIMGKSASSIIPPKILIWSFKEKSWWMPEAKGYTKSRAKAGRYSLQEALALNLSSDDGDIPHGEALILDEVE